MAIYDEAVRSVLEAERVNKEKYIFEVRYRKQFADDIKRVYEKKIECIETKKSIEFYQNAIDNNLTVSKEDLDKVLFEDMAGYQIVLDDMEDDLYCCKTVDMPSEEEIKEADEIFERLVLKCHPALYKIEGKEYLEFYDKVTAAYHTNNIPALLELEKNSPSPCEKRTDNLPEIIAKSQSDVIRVRNINISHIKYILRSEDSIKEYRERFNNAFDEYDQCTKEQKAILEKKIKAYEELHK